MPQASRYTGRNRILAALPPEDFEATQNPEDFTATQIGANYRNSPVADRVTQLKAAILDGVKRPCKSEGMDPYRDKLEPEQVDALVAYVRSLGK